MDGMITRARVVLGAAALFAFCVVPIALAAGEGSSGAPHATASGKSKKLKKRVKALEDQVAALQGEQGGARPPSGPAAGDLTGNYPNPAIAPAAIDSAKVADGSLLGTDIDESSLNAVPFAASAGNASSVNGLQSRAFQFTENSNTPEKTFLSLAGLVLEAECAASTTEIRGTAAPAGSFTQVGTNGGAASLSNIDDNAGSGTAVIVMRRGDAVAGSTTPEGDVVTVTLGWDTDTEAPECQLAGTALGRP